MTIRGFMVGTLVVALTTVVTAAARQRSAENDPFQIPSVQSLPSMHASMELRAWSDPRIVDGQQAELDPHSVVLGVRCGERSRAYCLPAREAGSPREDILIRDVFNDQTFTIAISGRDGQIVVWRETPDGKRQRHPYRLVPWYTWLKQHPRTGLASWNEPSAEQGT